MEVTNQIPNFPTTSQRSTPSRMKNKTSGMETKKTSDEGSDEIKIKHEITVAYLREYMIEECHKNALIKIIEPENQEAITKIIPPQPQHTPTKESIARK
jgi:hypothetical protein